MPFPTTYEMLHIGSLLPEILLLGVGCVLLLMLGPSRRLVPSVALAAVAAAYLLEFLVPSSTTGSGLNIGAQTTFVRLAALMLGLVLVLISFAQAREDERGEYFAMMLFSLAGLMLLSSASDLLMLFIALELVSIPTYVMVVLSRSSPKSLEAGTKYFYLGAMAAALTAYGFSFLYGVSGSADMSTTQIAVTAALGDPGSLRNTFAIIGLLLALVGLFFKVAAIPMHFYIADVYEGAASSVAGFLGFVPKLAGFVAILKVIALTGWNTGHGGLFWTLWLVAAVSMTVGNILAIRQHNIKRLLAYSGIAHSGYMLVGVLASCLYRDGGEQSTSLFSDGPGAVLFYMIAYGIANMCAFAVLGVLRVQGQACETLRDVAGLLRRQPLMAAMLAVAMFTLMGMPPTPGFWGKLSLFSSAWSAQNAVDPSLRWWMGALVIIGVVNSAIGAAYYLRVIAACILYESEEPADTIPAQMPQIGAMMAGIFLAIFAVYPSSMLTLGRKATIEWRQGSLAGAAQATPVAAANPAGADERAAEN